MPTSVFSSSRQSLSDHEMSDPEGNAENQEDKADDLAFEGVIRSINDLVPDLIQNYLLSHSSGPVQRPSPPLVRTPRVALVGLFPSLTW